MKVLALNKYGDITYCTVPADMRGKGRCNHVEHQKENETVTEFIERINSIQTDIKNKKELDQIHDNEEVKKAKEINQEDINNYAKRIDEIVGQKVTEENFNEIMNNLSPDQAHELAKIGFSAGSEFSLPITDKDYENENIKNKLYFANLPAYGIGGNKDAIVQMFDKIGFTPTLDGPVEIKHSYKEGLTPGEYFQRQFSSRDAMINKSVSTAKPGYCIYENSLVEIIDKEDEDEAIANNITETKMWKDIQVGDTFIDGSIVEEIQPWQYKECFKVKIEGYEPIVLSYDHLLFGDIIVNNKRLTNLEQSYVSRQNVGESDDKWIAVKDIYEFFKMGAQINISTDGSQVEGITLFKNGIPQKVRCISTSTGFYETNGMIHHNTARKAFYALSDVQVAKDCGGPYIDAMHCKMPEGHVCQKCANLTPGGENIKEGQLVGGWISTNLSEALTQLSMKQKHALYEKQKVKILKDE